MIRADASSAITLGSEGGVINLYYHSNIKCKAFIPEECRSWVVEQAPDTKTVSEQKVSVLIRHNPGLTRSVEISIVGENEDYDGQGLTEEQPQSVTFTITQYGGVSRIKDTTPPDNEIWYTTRDDKILLLDEQNHPPFPGKIISHTFINGKGVIRSEEPIIVIQQDAFLRQTRLTAVSLPKKLSRIQSGAFRFSGLYEIVLPEKLTIVGISAFAGCPNLRNIVLNEGLESIDMEAFGGNNLDCEIVFPSTLKYAGAYAFNSTGIKGFYGNSTFHTEDNKCFLESGAYGNTSDLVTLGRYIGGDTDYQIPEGIHFIQNYAFERQTELRAVGFPTTLKGLSNIAFNECPNIERIYGDCVSADGKSIIIGDKFCQLFLAEGVKEYSLPEGIKIIDNGAFSNAKDIETILLPDSITGIADYAFPCPNLRKIVFGASLQQIGMGSWPPLGYLPKIEEIYFRSYFPPKEYGNLDTQNLDHLTVYVPEKTLALYKNAKQWGPFASKMKGIKYDDIEEFDGYISSDYSGDGLVQTLHRASQGNGIDIILMGDAFSDRQIADGTYPSIMTSAMNAFFSEEPFASNQELFNVYSVQVVSGSEMYQYDCPSALGTHISESGQEDGGNYEAVINYAKKAVPEEKLDDALVLVLMNKNNGSGVTQIFDAPDGDYGRGLSIAYIPALCDEDTFIKLITHEAGGHGFAKLADEYAYGGQIDEWRKNVILNEVPLGRWKNIDFTGDPKSVKWSQFIADPRYQNEDIGCYEGAEGYLYGIWRPSDNSIMNGLVGGFNAPSRYAIWYRMNKLSQGKTWNGTYEDFVSFDQQHRSSASVSRPRRPQGTQQIHHQPPIRMGKAR